MSFPIIIWTIPERGIRIAWATKISEFLRVDPDDTRLQGIKARIIRPKSQTSLDDLSRRVDMEVIAALSIVVDRLP